jgi:putative ABC transport system permease protein
VAIAASKTSTGSRLRRWFGGHDVRHALRRWRRRPGFALTAILTLALGIGATTAIFSIVDAVLLRPLPWTDPDRLVVIHAVFPERRQNPASALTWNRGQISYPAWDALRREPVFEDIGVWGKPALDATFGEARTEMVQTMDVSSRFLPMLGVRLVHGRYFTEVEDNRPSDSILITYEAWQRRFGGRQDVVGQAVRLGSASSGGSTSRIVVGVVEAGFDFDGDPVPEVLLPVGIPSEVSRKYPSPSLRVVAKLAPGATLTAAATAADRVIRAVETRESTTGRVVPLPEEMVRGATRPLLLLFGGAAVLLLIACANVAGLLLGEARARRHEIAVRASLGGSRARVLRELLVEHAILGAAGVAAGLTLAYWLLKLCVAIAPTALPRLDTISLDARVTVFALVVGLVTVLIFGVIPALSLARTPAARVLAEGGRDGAAGRHLGQRLVVAGAIGLALVLLVGASLLGETLMRLAARPLGFDPANLSVISFRMTRLPNQPSKPITAAEYEAQTPGQRFDRLRFIAERQTSSWWLNMSGAMERVAAQPHVAAVAGAYTSPFLGVRLATNIRPSGRPAQDAIVVRQQLVNETYFSTLGTPILRGRAFAGTDRIGPAAAVRFRGPEPQPALPTIVSVTVERRFFGGDAVGRQILLGVPPTETVLNVIGVVPDTRWRNQYDDDPAAFYMLAEAHHGVNTFFVRTSAGAEAPLPAIRQALQDYNPNIVVTATASMETLVARSMAEERFRALLATIFGAAALVLAAVGLYGLAARRVADRRREIAVRVALGARPVDVRRLIVSDALRTIALGLLVGLPAAFAASQVTQTLLFGVTPTAPRVFATAAAVLALAAVLATILPARRAAAIDPMVVLKE